MVDYNADDLTSLAEEVYHVSWAIEIDDDEVREHEDKRYAEDGDFLPSSQESGSSQESDVSSGFGSQISAQSSQDVGVETTDSQEIGGRTMGLQEAQDDDSNPDATTHINREDEEPQPQPQPQCPASTHFDHAEPPRPWPPLLPNETLRGSKITPRMIRLIAGLYRRVHTDPTMSNWRDNWVQAVAILYDLDEEETEYVKILMAALGKRAIESVFEPDGEPWLFNIARFYWNKHAM